MERFTNKDLCYKHCKKNDRDFQHTQQDITISRFNFVKCTAFVTFNR